MLDSSNPTKIPLIWASSASSPYIHAIPTPSQESVTNGAASFTDGFPPLCFIPIASGGAGPFGADFNGLLQQITAGLQWLQAGAPVPFDSVFSGAVGGYPQGSIIQSSVTLGLLWISTVDNNTTNPDSATAANWIPLLGGILYQNTTFYVSASGSDSTGNGTSGAPFATIQHAANVATRLNVNGNVATINVSTGTYSSGGANGGGGVTVTGNPVGTMGIGSLIFTTSGGAVTINGNGHCFLSQGAFFTVQGNFVMNQVDFTGDPNSSIVSVNGGRVGIAGTSLQFGPSQGNHMTAASGGSITGLPGYAYSIGGTAVNHWSAQPGGNIIIQSGTVSFLGVYAFGEFAEADHGGVINCAGLTFSGPGQTGPRFLASSLGIIDTGGGGTTYLPGSIAGAGSTPGVTPYGLYL